MKRRLAGLYVVCVCLYTYMIYRICVYSIKCMYIYILCISVLIYADIRIQAAFGWLLYTLDKIEMTSQWKIDQPFRFDHVGG